MSWLRHDPIIGNNIRIAITLSYCSTVITNPKRTTSDWTIGKGRIPPRIGKEPVRNSSSRPVTPTAKMSVAAVSAEDAARYVGTLPSVNPRPTATNLRLLWKDMSEKAQTIPSH